VFFALVEVVVRKLRRALASPLCSEERRERAHSFLDAAGRQGNHIGRPDFGLISIWFDDPTRLTAAVGMATAGLAFSLQKVVTSLAGYVVILRGKTFSVGDRIVMGGVRGDVIALRFTQTGIMEMGQPPGEESDAPSMWVWARQLHRPHGVRLELANLRLLWVETTLTVDFAADVALAEQIMLKAAEQHTVAIHQISEELSPRWSAGIS